MSQIQKVLTSTHIGVDGGLLEPQQAERFLDLIWDQTFLTRDGGLRRIRMNSDTVELNQMHVGERLLRVATEAVDDHVVAVPRWSKIELRSTKLRLDWELSTESLEDSKEGETLEDTVARLMAFQIGQDMEELAINGDALSADPLMRAFDGYRTIAMNEGVVVSAGDYAATDAGTGNYANTVPEEDRGISRAKFAAALKALPRKYMNARNNLRFYVGSTMAVNMWEVQLPNPADFVREQPINSPAINGQYQMSAGVPVLEVPMFRDDLNYSGTAINETAGEAQYGALELTFPNNRIWGIKREIQVFREFKPKKDTIEYTVYTRVGAAVENPDIYVVVTGIETAPGTYSATTAA